MDLFDIFFGYGLFGLILYFIPLVYYIVEFLRKKKLFNSYTLICIMGIILMIIISTLSGHTLSAPATSIYLALLVSLAYKNQSIS